MSTDVKRPHDSFLSDLPQSRVVCMEDASLSVNTSVNNSKPNRMLKMIPEVHLLKCRTSLNLRGVKIESGLLRTFHSFTAAW